MFELMVSEYEKDRMRECLRQDREETRFRQTIKETQGIRNLFWLESEYTDINGQRKELTEQKKEELLRNLVKITNLKLIEKEWPLVDWQEEIKKKQITLEKLRPCLIRFCHPRTMLLETLLTRAVNEVVEDWPAEVPNPHTLLTNVPPAANYFTVIELFSAFL